jgi:hypothetical protein
MEFFLTMIMAGVIWVCWRAFRPTRSSDQYVSYSNVKQKKKPASSSTCKDDCLSIGTLFILDEIINDRSDSTNLNQDHSITPEETDCFDDDILCDDLDFFE